jgi:DNA-binding transcriptional LysR family regulator
VRLVNRTTRKLSLTAEGETYFHSGRRLIEEMDNLEHEVTAAAGHPRGLLRINTALSFGVQHLAPALIDFHRRYPEVRLSISLTERPVDLYAEQIDVAVRVGPSSDQRLMSRRIGEVARVLCASPKYLEQFGVPERREDLARHRCIAFTAQNRGRWAFRAGDGGVEYMDVGGVFASDNQECILQLALHGAGIGRLADYMVARPIRDGRLVALLADEHHAERTPAYAVFPPGTHKVPKLRVFLDFLIERFGNPPARPRSGAADRPETGGSERSRG